MPNGHGFSFPYGVPLVIYPGLAVGIALGAGKWWGYAFAVVTVAIGCIAVWEAMSRTEFEDVHTKDPTMNLLTWRINWLLFFALPALVLGLLGLSPLLGLKR